MKTIIDNNQRVFVLNGTGWNTQKYFCNLSDLVTCAKEFEKHQPYNVYEIWNFKLRKLTVNKVIELLEANQLDSSFFSKPIMKKVATGNGYDYYESIKTEKATSGKYYNIVPMNQPIPKGGYSKDWILGVKKVANLFP